MWLVSIVGAGTVTIAGSGDSSCRYDKLDQLAYIIYKNTWSGAEPCGATAISAGPIILVTFHNIRHPEPDYRHSGVYIYQ